MMRTARLHIGIVALIVTSAAAQTQSSAAVLTIHADQTASQVSPTLYGLMTEEINHSYEGGLYAEMVSNNTFHADWSGVLDWYLLENGDASAKCPWTRRRVPATL